MFAAGNEGEKGYEMDTEFEIERDRFMLLQAAKMYSLSVRFITIRAIPISALLSPVRDPLQITGLSPISWLLE